MKLHRFIFSPFQENTYVIWDDITNESCIIDPGCYSNSEEDELKEFIISNKLTVKYLINTHCHIDHIFGNLFIKTEFDPIFLTPQKDVPLLNMAIEQGKQFGIKVNPSPLPDKYIDELESLNIGNIELKFIFTPGHTPGEYCIYIPEENICITGDVLFKESIGRTDLWKGNYETLMNSIRTNLLTLPDETEIFPGHGSSSTIGYEKLNNSFLQ